MVLAHQPMALGTFHVSRNGECPACRLQKTQGMIQPGPAKAVAGRTQRSVHLQQVSFSGDDFVWPTCDAIIIYTALGRNKVPQPCVAHQLVCGSHYKGGAITEGQQEQDTAAGSRVPLTPLCLATYPHKGDPDDPISLTELL